jgi:hypothetical protein
VSKDGIYFRHWTSINTVHREGRQLFAIDPIGPSYKFIELIVKETFGANRTYMNQIFLLEQHPKYLHMKENLSENRVMSPKVIEQQMNNYLKEK